MGWLVIVLGEFVRRLHHHHGAGVFSIVLTNCLAMGTESFRLLDDVKAFSLIKQGIHLVERLQPGPTPRLVLPDSFTHRADFAARAAQKGHDLVGLTEKVRAEHNRIISVGRHAPSIP